jgi:hypothetical protein
VLDALAVALLLVSLVLFRADPMPSQVSASIPTYLGLRIHAQDVRAKLDLRRAVAAADAYGSGHGTFAGFDAAAASSADPALEWQDGLPREGNAPALTISILRASPTEARLSALSESGAAFCIQTSRSGETTFGQASQGGSSPPRPPREVLRAAARACGSTPWTDAAVAMPPTATMCDGLDPTGGYLTCRMVQALTVTTLRRTGPA